jgi:GNAT superfamily N-acetyltransferase
MRSMNVEAELAYRPATVDDAGFAADVDTAVHPQRPRDPLVYRYWWAQPDEFMEFARFVVTRGGRPIGFAEWRHARWDVQPDRYGTLSAELLPSERALYALDAATAELERRVTLEGARILRSWSNEDDPLRIEMLLARGYAEERRGKRWELDLVGNRDRLLEMTEESRERMRSEDVRLLTLADESDPAVVEKIWRMSEEAGDDVPTTMPRIPEAMASYVRWLSAPEIHRDRFWIARAGDEIVGVSVLGYPPTRGVVGTEWTATARSARGRGIARALKCETVAQAIALGVDRVRTGNDAANAPILHINETMGYRQIAGTIEFLKQPVQDEVRATP